MNTIMVNGMTREAIFAEVEKAFDRKGFSESTRKTYRSNINSFLEYTQKNEWTELKEKQLIDYMDTLIYLNVYAPQTINVRISAAKFLYEHVLKEPYSEKRVPLVKIPKKEMPVLTPEQCIQFIDQIPRIDYKAMFILACGGGLRSEEISKLRVMDIETMNNRIHIQSGKGDKERYTVLSKNVLFILRCYWISCKPPKDGYLFPSSVSACGHITTTAVEAAFRRYYNPECYGGINATVHTLRHSFATGLAMNGEDLFTIKMLMGHASVSTTERYVHISKTMRYENISNPFDSKPLMWNGRSSNSDWKTQK